MWGRVGTRKQICSSGLPEIRMEGLLILQGPKRQKLRGSGGLQKKQGHLILGRGMQLFLSKNNKLINNAFSNFLFTKLDISPVDWRELIYEPRNDNRNNSSRGACFIVSHYGG